MGVPEQRNIFDEIADERERQDKKFGVYRDYSPEGFLCVLTEEVGEVAKEINDATLGGLSVGQAYRTELIQVAAVAVAAVESYDRVNKKATVYNGVIWREEGSNMMPTLHGDAGMDLKKFKDKLTRLTVEVL